MLVAAEVVMSHLLHLFVEVLAMVEDSWLHSVNPVMLNCLYCLGLLAVPSLALWTQGNFVVLD